MIQKIDKTMEASESLSWPRMVYSDQRLAMKPRKYLSEVHFGVKMDHILLYAYKIGLKIFAIFRQASVSRTYPCKLVGWSVGHTFGFPISGQ